ncbi:MAG: phosphoglycerate kinase [Candidatus Aminicenantes bacterium]|nr:phosphoglycerate kinase [Candidatus Aminicenantes bacterium]
MTAHEVFNVKIFDLPDAFFQTGAAALGEVRPADSLVENDSVDFCKKVIDKANDRKIKLLLPSDHLAVQDIEKPESAKITENQNIGAGWKGVDIGPKTVSGYAAVIATAKTIFWNGPMGIFEIDAFAQGTIGIAKAVAASNAISIVGGGDSIAAVKKAGVRDKISHISTGGGASLEYIAYETLPGIAALEK